MIFPEKRILKITCDKQGIVWYMAGNNLPVNSNVTSFEFVEGLKESDLKFPKLRVIGTRANSELLIRLFDAKTKQHITSNSIEVCSPLISAKTNGSPEEVLYSTLQWTNKPASKGGWHEFTAQDCVNYGMSAMIIHNDGKVDDRTKRYLTELNELWPYLSFIGTLDTDACCRLVSLVLDPRWYIDQAHPDRNSKLESYLGLGSIKSYDPFANVVKQAWSGNTEIPEDYSSNPRHFLWRTWLKHGGGDKGDLKASQSFISYLKHTWLSCIYRDRPEPLFDPDLFFKDAIDAGCFRKHLESFTRE